MHQLKVLIVLFIFVSSVLLSADENINVNVLQDNITIIKTAIKKNKPKPVKLTKKQTAAVALNVTGSVILLAGAGLLTASLVYADYLEKNEKDYDKYITGKKISRGLFYASTGTLGTGTVCIIISIPLFIKKKGR